MSNLLNTLDRIVLTLSNLNHPVAQLLQPALTAADITKQEQQLPFTFPHELDTLYQWHNGTRLSEGDMLGLAYLFPGFYLLSLEEAVKIYHVRKDSQQWQANWFPVFADGGGDFYVLSCTEAKREGVEVIGFIHGEPEQVVEYENLTTMFQTIETCYAQGAFFIDNGELEVDDDKHRPIARLFNPEVKEWQD